MSKSALGNGQPAGSYRGCAKHEASGSKRTIDHPTIERRFAPALKKGRHRLARMLRSHLVRRAITGDTAALIFACKTILGLREPRSDEFNLQVSAMATAAAKPADFAITEEVKKKVYEAALVIRREAASSDSERCRTA